MDFCADSLPDHQLGAELTDCSGLVRGLAVCRFLGSSWRPCAIWSRHCTPDWQPRATLAATGCQTAQHHDDAAATPGLHNHLRTCACNQGRKGQQAQPQPQPNDDMQSRWWCCCFGERESAVRVRHLVTTPGRLQLHAGGSHQLHAQAHWPPQQSARPPSSSKARLWWDRRSGRGVAKK